MSQENDIEHSMSANDVSGVLADQSEVLLDTNGENHFNESHDEQWQERESRNALKHVSGLGEMQDVTEVEYRKVRLERVVLVGVFIGAALPFLFSALTMSAVGKSAQHVVAEVRRQFTQKKGILADVLLSLWKKGPRQPLFSKFRPSPTLGVTPHNLGGLCHDSGRRRSDLGGR